MDTKYHALAVRTRLNGPSSKGKHQYNLGRWSTSSGQCDLRQKGLPEAKGKMAIGGILQQTHQGDSIVIYHDMVSSKNVKTLFLKTRTKSAISDSLNCLFSCRKNFLFWVSRLAKSTVVLAISLVATNACKTGTEYWGWDTSLFRRISASRISKLLHMKTKNVVYKSR